VHQLERKLDNIVLGGLKLYVNIPKFGRARLGMPQPATWGRAYARQYEEENRGTYPAMKQPVVPGLK